MTELEVQDLLQIVAQQQKQLLAQQNIEPGIDSLSNAGAKSVKKDRWDIVAALAPIVSGVTIALCGAYFTTIYNQQQLKLQEIQTIEKFIPHLVGDEKSKRAAILAISSLTDTQLAAKVAAIYASEGTISALEQIAEHGNSGDRKIANAALAKTLDNMAENYYVEKRYEDAIKTGRKALALWEKSYGFQSIKIIPSLLRLAELLEAHKDFVEAEALLLRVTEIQKDNYGAESVQLADGLQCLSRLYQRQGLLAKADAISKQASAIEEKLSESSSAGLLNSAARENASDVSILDAETADSVEQSGGDLPAQQNSQATESNVLPPKVFESAKPADRQLEQLKTVPLQESSSNDAAVLPEAKETVRAVSSRARSAVHLD